MYIKVYGNIPCILFHFTVLGKRDVRTPIQYFQEVALFPFLPTGVGRVKVVCSEAVLSVFTNIRYRLVLASAPLHLFEASSEFESKMAIA